MIEKELSVNLKDIVLSGTVCLPDENEVYPIVLMIHGSGL